MTGRDPKLRLPTRATAVKIALLYGVLGALWIACLGWLLQDRAHPDNFRALLGNVKGWCFIVMTSFLLGWTLDYYFRTMRRLGKRFEDELTERQQAEAALRVSEERLRQLQEQFRQVQKIEAVGRLAGGVAHDFNNILTATLLHIGLLQRTPDLTAGMREALEELEGGVTRARELTRQLLLFSRRETAKFEPVELNAAIHGFLRMLRRLLGEQIAVEFHPCAEAAWVKADRGMLEQVILNLCVNARDAMPKGGNLTLRTGLAERNSESVRDHTDSRCDRFVRLEVTDTGSGMAEAILKRIFEPFFTTKEAGKGTGLGLATVHGIVKQHEGWIEVQSQVGKGSTFLVYFPAVPGPVQVDRRAQDLEEVRGGSETILLVEDDSPLRRVVARCLSSLGYTVLEATNGADALRIGIQHQDSIGLLLTDMVISSGTTGLELGQRLRSNQPGLPVILFSGYSPDSMRLGSIGTDFAYLSKPFEPGTLARLVRQALDKASRR